MVANGLRIPNQSKLHGKRFSELENRLQNRIEDCNLTLYIIDSNAPERARLDIFERVNGGVPLSRQQMRNCLYMGPGTQFLKNEAQTRLFLEVTSRSLNSKQMRDREFINRFCAFDLFSSDHYRGDMDLFLAETLAMMNRFEEGELTQLSTRLQNGLTNNFELFGSYAFRKHTREQEGRRSPINASLWDVMCTGLSRYSTETVKARKHALLEEFYTLLEDEVFVNTISLSTNQTAKVHWRFDMANDMLKEVLGDQQP